MTLMVVPLAGIAAYLGAALAAAKEGNLAKAVEQLTAAIEELERMPAEVSLSPETINELAQAVATAIALGAPAPVEPGVPAPPPVTVKIERVIPEPQVILRQRAIGATGTFNCDSMADCRAADRILIWVKSTLDQDVQIQAIGNIFQAIENSIPLGSTATLPAGDFIGITIPPEYWYPYIGIQIVVAVAPTSGELNATVVTQE